MTAVALAGDRLLPKAGVFAEHEAEVVAARVTDGPRYRSAVRVIGGELRGRRLQSPPGLTARPATDRVREAVFGALGSLGAVVGAEVLDLFGGSGALGIEALSRGAASATFVERDREVRRVLGSNVEHLGLGDRAEVLAGDAERFLAEGRPGHLYDLAFLDPPYAFDAWESLLEAVPASLVVARSDRPIAFPPQWRVLRERRYGDTLVVIAERIAEP